MSGTACPRCGQHVARGDTNHDYACLETMLMALYQIGVRRGLEGEAAATGFDDKGAELIGEVVAMAWAWREEALGRRMQSLGQGLGAGRPRAGTDEDLDTQIARFLGWENIGWLGQQPVSGEAAWNDPRVVRRRFSQRYDDAMIVKRHQLLRPYMLIQVHRIHSVSWEWHVAAKNSEGNLETLVREATAPMAVCRAAIMLSGRGAPHPLAG